MKPKTRSIVAKFIYNDSKISTQSMKWDQGNKKNAFKSLYAKEMPKHQELKTEKCGTFLEKLKSYIAPSPDGIDM